MPPETPNQIVQTELQPPVAPVEIPAPTAVPEEVRQAAPTLAPAVVPAVEPKPIDLSTDFAPIELDPIPVQPAAIPAPVPIQQAPPVPVQPNIPAQQPYVRPQPQQGFQQQPAPFQQPAMYQPQGQAPQQQMTWKMHETLARAEAEAAQGRVASERLRQIETAVPAQTTPDMAAIARNQAGLAAGQEYFGDGYTAAEKMMNAIVNQRVEAALSPLNERITDNTGRIQTNRQAQSEGEKYEVCRAWLGEFKARGIPENNAVTFIERIRSAPETQNIDAAALGNIIGAQAYKFQPINAGQQQVQPQPQPQPTQYQPQPAPQPVVQPQQMYAPQPAAVPMQPVQPVVQPVVTPQMAAQQAKIQGQFAAGPGSQPAVSTGVSKQQMDSLIIQQALRDGFY